MAIETFSLFDNYENKFVVKNVSYEEAAALRDSKEPVATHNYYDTYQYSIYSDTYNTHWKDNPMEYEIKSKTVNSEDNTNIYLAPGGGFAFEFKEIIK